MSIQEEAKYYLEKNKNKILEQIKFISGQNHETFDETKKRIFDEFTNFDVTNHEKTIVYKGKKYNISAIADSIKNNEKETLLCFVLKQDEFVLLQQIKGNQQSCSLSLADSIKFNYAIAKAQLPFFIIHNHPFVCKATFSGADIPTFLNLKELADEFKIDLLDFAVVTKFDYISGLRFIQEYKQ